MCSTFVKTKKNMFCTCCGIHMWTCVKWFLFCISQTNYHLLITNYIHALSCMTMYVLCGERKAGKIRSAIPPHKLVGCDRNDLKVLLSLCFLSTRSHSSLWAYFLFFKVNCPNPHQYDCLFHSVHWWLWNRCVGIWLPRCSTSIRSIRWPLRFAGTCFYNKVSCM